MYVLELEWRLEGCDPTTHIRQNRITFLTEIQTEFKLLTETQTNRLNELGNSCISRLRDCHFESFAKEKELLPCLTI